MVMGREGQVSWSLFRVREPLSQHRSLSQLEGESDLKEGWGLTHTHKLSQPPSHYCPVIRHTPQTHSQFISQPLLQPERALGGHSSHPDLDTGCTGATWLCPLAQNQPWIRQCSQQLPGLRILGLCHPCCLSYMVPLHEGLLSHDQASEEGEEAGRQAGHTQEAPVAVQNGRKGGMVDCAP